MSNENETTVGQLIEMLEMHDPDAPVGFAYPAGDYGRSTIVAAPMEVEEELVRYTEYHRSMVIARDDSDDDTVGWVVIKE